MTQELEADSVEWLALLASSLSTAQTGTLVTQLMLRDRQMALADLVERTAAALEHRGLPDRDVDILRLELTRAYAMQLEALTEASLRSIEEPISSATGPSSVFRRAAGPIALSIAAATLGGSIVVLSNAWVVAATLVAAATAIAWMSKLEHDRRFADVVASAREGAAATGLSLERLRAALSG